MRVSLRPLSETLERIRVTAGMDAAVCDEILGDREDPEQAAARLASYLNLSAEGLLLGDVDFAEIAKTHRRAITVFPEKYSIAAFGRRRTTITSLDFIEKRSGWRTRADCLKHFGVDESLFTDPMASISMAFITDLCAYLHKKHGYRPADFFAMGAYSSTGNRKTLLSETFSRGRKPSEVYELLFGEMLKYYEQNCSYELQQLDDTSGVVHVTSNPYMPEALGVRALGNPQICALKAGWIACALDYMGLPFARVMETKCVHRGDEICRFEFDFSEATALRRPFSRGRA